MTDVNITPEFERALLSSCGGSLVATCSCGVTHFVDESPDYEPGEAKRLREAKARDPERYVCVFGSDHSVHHSQIMGRTYVWGCPCKYAERVEHLLWENRSAIIEYFTDRTKADAARAAADGGALGELAREMVRNYDRETPCRGKTPPVAPRDDNDNDNDNESGIIIAGRRVPFVQVGMIVHPDDCLNCEREGSPLWCSALVCDIHDDDETARFGMMATLLFRNGERREEPCNELRRRWRLARDFDQTRVYTGRWGVTPRGSVWPVAEVNEEA